jgi:hypothetical protein
MQNNSVRQNEKPDNRLALSITTGTLLLLASTLTACYSALLHLGIIVETGHRHIISILGSTPTTIAVAIFFTLGALITISVRQLTRKSLGEHIRIAAILQFLFAPLSICSTFVVLPICDMLSLDRSTTAWVQTTLLLISYGVGVYFFSTVVMRGQKTTPRISQDTTIST